MATAPYRTQMGQLVSIADARTRRAFAAVTAAQPVPISANPRWMLPSVAQWSMQPGPVRAHSNPFRLIQGTIIL